MPANDKRCIGPLIPIGQLANETQMFEAMALNWAKDGRRRNWGARGVVC
jgi:hypothetical protein